MKVGDIGREILGDKGGASGGDGVEGGDGAEGGDRVEVGDGGEGGVGDVTYINQSMVGDLPTALQPEDTHGASLCFA